MFWTLGSKVDSGQTRLFSSNTSLSPSLFFTLWTKTLSKQNLKDDHKIIMSKANRCNQNQNINKNQNNKKDKSTSNNNNNNIMQQPKQEQL